MSAPIALATITISGSRSIQLVLDEDCGPLREAATGDAKVACLDMLNATIGDRADLFARVSVSPEGGACQGTECSTADGIAARTWRVDATDRNGARHVWRCAYRNETAACTVVAGPAPS
jgi:hypothetical protein